MALPSITCRALRHGRSIAASRLVAIVLIVFAASISQAGAATYYVDPQSGSNSNSGQSAGAAWADMSPVAGQTSSGDTIILNNMDTSITSVTWPDRTYKAASISQFGITWTFNTNYRIGQFANRDMWVLGPVTIVSINPPSKNVSGRIANGSMLNPMPPDSTQGFDSGMKYCTYDAALNVAYNVSSSNPLTLPHGSLVSTISIEAAEQRPQLKTAAILTVLTQAASFGSFRPPYSSDTKTVEHNASNLNYDLLPRLTPVASTPDLATVERYFERPWLDHCSSWVSRYQHPTENMPDYGREIAVHAGIGALMLELDFTNEQKSTLLARYVQLGIDLNAIAVNGGDWPANGGHAAGRKWPILFAGMVLNDTEMKAIGQVSGDYLNSPGHGPGNLPSDYVMFGEDDQTFYVTPDDVYSVPYTKNDYKGEYIYYGHGEPVKSMDYADYTEHHLGMPDWGIRHATDRNRDGLDWGASYRLNTCGQAWPGFVLAALLMDAKDLWNHDALFDYQDRYMEITAPNGTYPGYRANNDFFEEMWDTYRASCGDVFQASQYDFVDPEPPSSISVTSVTSSSIRLSWGASPVAVDGDGATAYRLLRNDILVADGIQGTTYTDTGLADGTSYTYRLHALDDVGIESPAGVSISASTSGSSDDSTPPSVPSGLTGTATADEVALNWQPSSDSGSSVSHYNVYRDDRLIGASAGTSYADTGVSPGKEYDYKITAVDTAGNESAASAVYPVTVPADSVPETPSNQAPTLSSIGSRSVGEGTLLSFTLSASDPDGDSISYSATGLPSGAALSGSRFSWTPGYDQAGTHQVTFTATDGSAQDSETIAISVSNTNRAPVLQSIGGQSVDEENLLTFALAASDPDGDSVSYSASSMPSGATLNGNAFSWTPTSGQVGSFSITFAASDGSLQDTETITVSVAETAPDGTAPAVTQCSPEPDAIQAPLNNLMTLHITDGGKGVDGDSVVIRMDGNIVYQGNVSTYESAHGRCSRSGTRNNYRFIYQGDELLPFDHLAVVTVDAADVAGNVMTTYSHVFTTEMRAFGNNLIVSNGSGDKSHPATVGDSAGNLRAVWAAGAEGSRNIYAATMTAVASSFGTPAQLTTSEADQCHPDIAVDDDGRLYVVWQDNRNGNWDIFVSTSSNGTTWSSPVQVTDSEYNEINPAIVVVSGSPDRAYVTWQDDRAGQDDIYVASATNDFADSTVSQVTSNGADQLDPDIAVDGADTVYLIWTDMRNGQADIYGASSEGGTWTNVPVVTTSSSQTNPAIAAEQDTSIIHLLWVDDTPDDNDVYYAWSNGLPGSPLTGATVIDDTSGADQGQPSIVCLDNSKVFGCWQDWRHATGNNRDADLFMAELESGSAGTNVLVGDDSTNSGQSEPAIGIDGYGNPYMVWTDDRDAADEIYYAGTTFIDPTALDSKLVQASVGATIGPNPAEADEPEDVSIIVPAGACQCDVRITITKILNPQAMPVQCLGSYDFGPSGIEFNEPVTVTIPYRYTAGDKSAKPYWYDSLTGALSQQGITDIQNLVISDDLYALQFKTTHFTPFYLVVDDPIDTGTSGGGGGGGCSISVTGGGSPKDMVVPYGIIAIVMVALRRRDKKRSKVSSDIAA